VSNQQSAPSSQQYPDGGIDAGLLLLCATTPPLKRWTLVEIAFVCGCSRTNIWLIEQNALRKLRRSLSRRDDVKELLNA
jgi:hypothetical protein